MGTFLPRTYSNTAGDCLPGDSSFELAYGRGELRTLNIKCVKESIFLCSDFAACQINEMAAMK